MSRHVVARDRLPHDRDARDELLQRYFPDQAVTARLVGDEWELDVEFFDQL
jgi:hypothetical protein